MNSKSNSEDKKYTQNEILDYAKLLYLEIGQDKKKKYSLQAICNKIKEECNKSVTRTTMMRWSKKYEWDSLFVKTIQHNIKRAEAENEIEERDILEEKGKGLRDLYKNALVMSKLTTDQLEYLVREKEISEQGLLKLNKDSNDTIMKLNEFGENGNNDDGIKIEIVKTYEKE